MTASSSHNWMDVIQVKTFPFSFILVVPLTFCWYFASSKNAIATQKLVQTHEIIGQDSSTAIAIMTVLTSLQILFGIFISFPLYFFSKSKQAGCREAIKEGLTRLEGTRKEKTNFCIVGSFHFIGCFFTNMSFSYGSATLVQVVKLLEPVQTLIFTAFVTVFFSLKPHHSITTQQAIGTVLIVTGALMLLLQRGIQANISPAAVGFALLSGFCMVSRNVIQKSDSFSHRITGKKETTWLETLSNGLRTFCEINIIAGILSLTVLLLTPRKGDIISLIWNTFGGYGVQAVSFHSLYNLASISVLSITTAQTHSLLNVGKRITTVIAAALFFCVQLDNSAYLGLFISIFGGAVYAGVLRKFAQYKRCRKRLCVILTSIFLFGNIAFRSSIKLSCDEQSFELDVITINPSTMPSNEPSALRHALPSSEPSSRSLLSSYNFSQVGPKRKIVLLGAYERFNFGDLLFEKVLSQLLEKQLGYNDYEIVRGATVARDMSPHGGYHNIVSMKQVQQMSRTSAAGPFDIIYAGGECFGCSFDCAMGMLPTAELRKSAKAEKVYDCAYLFPKDLLLPLDDKQNPDRTKTNVAIVNSLGGYPGLPSCNAVSQSADYIAYRDSDPLVPDSALMVKELFGDIISNTVDKVMNSIFPEGTENKKYVAVQFKSDHFSQLPIESLAKELDEIAIITGCTIVFFAAGTAPNHDSFDSYQRIASNMTEPNFVYESERVFDIVAAISGSEAVLGTSLHVRIMAFMFHKPRVTWCSGNKHKKFIHTWEAPDMRTCGSLNTTSALLRKYMGPTPEVTQEQTKEHYELLVKKYMESFAVWATLLNKTNQRLPFNHQ